MGKKKNIADKPNYKPSNHIPYDRAGIMNVELSFSFKYLDSDNDKFSIDEREAAYFLKVIDRLKDISSLKAMEFIQNKSKALKTHPINWGGTSEPRGFRHLNSQLQDITPYQFVISGNEHGRVHGFLLGSVFNIVWFDPEHKLYP